MWSVYFIRCADGTLYTGIATDVPRRFAEHESGQGRAAKYLRGRGPLELVFEGNVGEDRGLALRVEARLKKVPRSVKLGLIEGRESLEPIIARARA